MHISFQGLVCLFLETHACVWMKLFLILLGLIGDRQIHAQGKWSGVDAGMTFHLASSRKAL